MTMTNGNGPFAVTPGTALLGEIITWSCSGVSIRLTDLVEALRDAGLDEGVARELAPRHAFSRACKKLSEARIIRPVAEDAHHITFQFTKESRASDSYEYTLETRLTLEKSTGKVACDLPGLATLAQEELDRCIAARSGADVTRAIQRLFEREADLFPIREKGGCYFVPERHSAFVDRIDRFVKKLNGGLGRFPVPAGTSHGDRSVREAVASGIETLIREHDAAVEGFGEDTRESTFERAAERIKQTRFKIEAYGEYLAGERSRLERELSQAQARLRAKVEALAGSETPLVGAP
jgi:hypothetical protein